MMCTPSAHPPEEPSSCAPLPERAVLLRALRDRWEARRWGCAGPRTLGLGQAMQWCLFCLKEKLWSFCIWRKNVGNKRICRGSQTWGKDRIRKAVSVCYLIQGYEFLLWRSYVRRTCANVMPKTKTFFCTKCKIIIVSSLPFPRTFLWRLPKDIGELAIDFPRLELAQP